MRFEPIAIVGRGCVLPGALDPDGFWENVAAGRTSLTAAPEGRWRLPRHRVMGTVDDHLDRTWTDIGGYVEGFESVFDPEGFLLPRSGSRRWTRSSTGCSTGYGRHSRRRAAPHRCGAAG